MTSPHTVSESLPAAPAPNSDPNLLLVGEALAALGATAQCLHAIIRSETLPATRLGGSILVRRQHLDKWIVKNAVHIRRTDTGQSEIGPEAIEGAIDDWSHDPRFISIEERNQIVRSRHKRGMSSIDIATRYRLEPRVVDGILRPPPPRAQRGRKPATMHEVAVCGWMTHRDPERARKEDDFARNGVWDPVTRGRGAPLAGGYEQEPAELYRLLSPVEGQLYLRAEVMEQFPPRMGRPNASRSDRKIASSMVEYILGPGDRHLVKGRRPAKGGRKRPSEGGRKLIGQVRKEYRGDLVETKLTPPDGPTTLAELAASFGFPSEKSPSFRRVWAGGEAPIPAAERYLEALEDFNFVIDGNGNPSDIDTTTMRTRLEDWKVGVKRGRKKGSKNRHE